MKKILIIEDNLEVRENIEEILELYGYEVLTAPNGKVGVQIAKDEHPHLIICDIMMPELDGYGVLSILNKWRDTAKIPFVFLTAKSEKSDLRRGMNLGADDYLTKPFYKDELLQVIETRLNKSTRLQADFPKNETGLAAFIDEAKGYEALKKLSLDRKRRTFKKKESLFQEEDYPRYLYFINSGKVKIFKTNEDGKEYIISIAGEGDFVGYVDLIQDSEYSESCAALEDSEVSLIPKEAFNQLLHANRDVANRFIKLLANNISEKESQLLDLAYDSVRQRVAKALLKVHKEYSRTGKTEIQFLRDDLARIVGTAKESVIRMLTEFKNDGYIDIVDGKISVLDEKGLKF